MAEVEQQPTSAPSSPKKKRRILRSFLLTILIILLLLASSLVIMMSTDRGSRFLLDRVLEAQKIIKYEYEGGNLLRGIILKNVLVQLKDVDVSLDRADVGLGWRSLLLEKEVHLSHADVRNLRIINKTPPSGKPFEFKPIKLPFVLRVDEGDVDHLEIKLATSDVSFHDVHLQDALWSETKLEFEKSSMDMGYLSVHNATGKMDFSGKYPLDATADLRIPSLKSLNIQNIKVAARGSLDTIKAGVATTTPDLLTGWVILHPVRDEVPMQGELLLKNYHLPLLQEQKLFAKNGVIKFQGDIKQLNLALDTDLKGENLPEGQYNALMNTDLVHQLNITDFNGQVMKGAVNLKGLVNWKDHVTWDIKGRLDRINPKDKAIPQVVQDFLPPSLDAAIASTGSLEKGTEVFANVDFDRYESWKLKLNQAPEKNNKPQPMLMNVAWANIDRAMPYIGWLSSDNGQVDLTLRDGQQDIKVATKVYQHEKTLLPAGQYLANLNVKDNILNVPNFSFAAEKGSLTGQAKVLLPTEKRQLAWNALLNANDFNPQSIQAAAPVNLLNGSIKANGFAKPNQQIIQFEKIDLTGRLAQAGQETVSLGGKSTAALLFHDVKAGGGFKGFAVNYDGSLKALKQANGLLKFSIAGTPDFIRISQLQHDGVAGKIYATGSVNLKDRIAWDINSSLVRFKPQYFASTVKGEISGNLKTQGVWSDHLKRINIQQLNLAGFLNNKPVRGKGNLSLLMDFNQNGFFTSAI